MSGVIVALVAGFVVGLVVTRVAASVVRGRAR